MHVDFPVDDRINVGDARLQPLVIALLNAIPYGEDVRRITIARNSTGYAIAIRTSKREA